MIIALTAMLLMASLLVAVPSEASADEVSVPASVSQDRSTTVAVLVRAAYFQFGMGFPQVLYYNNLLATFQTLRYMGIPAEIVTDSINQSDLNEYGGLIVVRGEGNCWALTKAYAETTGNPVLWIHLRGSDGAMAAALGIIDYGQVLAVGPTPTLSNSGPITEDLNDTWGTLGAWTTRNISLNDTLSTWTRYLTHAGNDSQPYLFGAEHNGSTYYIYATADSFIASGSTGRYYTQLVLNYAHIAMPNLIRWMPMPSAKDSGLIIRADDVIDLDSKWLAFWERYPHSTSAVQASLAQNVADYIAAHCDDYLPHGYAHEDFTALSYAEQVSLLEQINAAWAGRFGERPYCYIMPYNKADENTGKAMNATGGQFYMTAVSLTGLPSTYYYRHHDNQAVTWGAYYEGGTFDAYLDQIIGQGRFAGSYVFHPYAMDWENVTSYGDAIIDRVLNEPSTMLTTWSEVAELYMVRQHITTSSEHIQFGVDVPAGLTMEWRYLTAGKTLKVGDRVLPRVGDRVVFPAMDAGVYAYELVDLTDYPVVTSIGTGMALKDGSYNVSSGRTTITVEGWHYNGTVTRNITLSTADDLSLLDEGGRLLTRDLEATFSLSPGTYVVLTTGALTTMQMGGLMEIVVAAVLLMMVVSMIGMVKVHKR